MTAQGAQVLDAGSLIDCGPGRAAQVEAVQLRPRQRDQPLGQLLQGVQLAFDLTLARALRGQVIKFL